MMAREISMSCWPAGDHSGCDAQVCVRAKRYERSWTTDQRLQDKAGALGWHIGFASDAQAYYVCPEHKNTVFDPVPLTCIRC
jgi:hypothetical protein